MEMTTSGLMLINNILETSVINHIVEQWRSAYPKSTSSWFGFEFTGDTLIGNIDAPELPEWLRPTIESLREIVGVMFTGAHLLTLPGKGHIYRAYDSVVHTGSDMAIINLSSCIVNIQFHRETKLTESIDLEPEAIIVITMTARCLWTYSITPKMSNQNLLFLRMTSADSFAAALAE